VEDLYFDDERWTVRYLVVRCGGWFAGKEVQLSPASVVHHDAAGERIVMKLTREGVRNSPDASAERPVSRRFEEAHASRPASLGGGDLSRRDPDADVPAAPAEGDVRKDDAEAAKAELEAAARSHLRSCREVTGYVVQASDGDGGTVDDMLIDDRSWEVTHLVVDARPWWPGDRVHVAPSTVQAINWASRTVQVGKTRDDLKASLPP
jgi:hypothetical protein